jgi:hypothetical protein
MNLPYRHIDHDRHSLGHPYADGVATFVVAGLNPEKFKIFHIQNRADGELFYGMQQAHGTLNVSALENQISMHLTGIGISYALQQPGLRYIGVPRGRLSLPPASRSSPGHIGPP